MDRRKNYIFSFLLMFVKTFFKLTVGGEHIEGSATVDLLYNLGVLNNCCFYVYSLSVLVDACSSASSFHKVKLFLFVESF